MHIGLGVVKVNNQVVTELGYQVQEGDIVHFDGKRITPEKRPMSFSTSQRDLSQPPKTSAVEKQ